MRVSVWLWASAMLIISMLVLSPGRGPGGARKDARKGPGRATGRGAGWGARKGLGGILVEVPFHRSATFQTSGVNVFSHCWCSRSVRGGFFSCIGIRGSISIVTPTPISTVIVTGAGVQAQVHASTGLSCWPCLLVWVSRS